MLMFQKDAGMSDKIKKITIFNQAEPRILANVFFLFYAQTDDRQTHTLFSPNFLLKLPHLLNRFSVLNVLADLPSTHYLTLPS